MNLVISGKADRCEARCDGTVWPCAVGKAGIGEKMLEGDGLTPIGCWPIRQVLYRPDRMDRPKTCFPCAEIRENDGWCDDSADPMYNRKVALPYPSRHERLWRDDEIYDCIAVLGFNDDPPMPGAGSAIFLHVARPGHAATEGCVALAREHLLEFLSRASSVSRILVEAPVTEPADQD